MAAFAPLFGFGDEIVVSHLVLGVEHRKHRTIFVSAGSTWQSLTLLLATACPEPAWMDFARAVPGCPIMVVLFGVEQTGSNTATSAREVILSPLLEPRQLRSKVLRL